MFLSASVVQMIATFNICYEFGVLCDLKFNCVKSFWGLVGKLSGSGVVESELGSVVVPRCDIIPLPVNRFHI